MTDHEHHMRRCLQLARNGAGQVAPNPMVGAVLAQGDHVLAEGWHRSYGGAHAEVECLKAFGDGTIPADAVMYVNLEPCSHHGKTPPCADLLVARDVRTVMVGSLDPNPLVSGKGIARMREAGIDVRVGLLGEECRWSNRRFFHDLEQGCPYIILKWARSADGFLDDHGRPVRISSQATDVLVHRWRSEEQAVLLGSRTVVNDDPQLTVRHVEGRNPLRVVMDRKNGSSAGSKVFNGSAPTLLFTEIPRGDVHAEQHVLSMIDDPIDGMLRELHRRHVRSVLVEGGAELLGHFLRRGVWDEARVITGEGILGKGTSAPSIGQRPTRSFTSGTDRIDLFTNGNVPHPAWAW